MKLSETLPALAMPLCAALVGGILLFWRRDLFPAFREGAAEGLRTAVNLLPTLTALLVGVSMLNASGAVGLVSGWLAPLAGRIGVPSELLPLLLTRPFSGSATTAALTELFGEVGADGLAGLCASVIFGSSDTVVYVLSVYFSSVGIRKTRYAFPVALAVMLFCIFFSCFLCRLLFA